VSDISHQDFLVPAKPVVEAKWTYRRTFVTLAGLSALSWAAIIIACALLFHWRLM
jgi:hypothetical protein